MMCCLGGFSGVVVFGEGCGVALGWGGELGVSDGGAVAAHVDGVYDGEGAAYSEDEAEAEADGCGPVDGHDV